MGDIVDEADEYICGEWGEEEDTIRIVRKYYKDKTLYWRTQEGDNILVQEMTDIHLFNTIDFLERKPNPSYITTLWIEILKEEVNNRKIVNRKNNKRILSPEDILNRDRELLESVIDGETSSSFGENFISNWMREYAREVIKYTLEQAAENGTVKNKQVKLNNMKRIALTDGTGRWFDRDKAELIEEETWWDGRNWISKATGSQWEHEALYRTKGGKWILNHWSNYQGSEETYEEITNEEAAKWLSKQELEPHEDCEKEYQDLEIH